MPEDPNRPIEPPSEPPGPAPRSTPPKTDPATPPPTLEPGAPTRRPALDADVADADLEADKTDMGAVGDDGQVFGG